MENFEEDDFEDSFVDESEEVETPEDIPMDEDEDSME